MMTVYTICYDCEALDEKKSMECSKCGSFNTGMRWINEEGNSTESEGGLLADIAKMQKEVKEFESRSNG